MTTTLLVHEFRRTRGPLGLVAGAAALLVAAGVLLALAPWPLVASFGAVVGVGAVGAMLPVACCVLAVDYWRSGYGRLGYFTHSLPVRGARIYAVRLAYGLLVSLAGTALTAVLAIPVWMAAVFREVPEGTSLVAYLADAVRQWLVGVPAWALVGGPAVIVLAAWGSLVGYYFAASIGSGSRFAGLHAAGPIVVFVLLYVVAQLAAFAGIVAIPWAVGRTGADLGLVRVDIIGVLASGSGANDVMPVGFLVTYAVLGLVLIAWTARAWDHDVTLR